MVTVVVSEAPTLTWARSVPLIPTSNPSLLSNMSSSIIVTVAQFAVGIGPAGIVMLVPLNMKSAATVWKQ